jgi:hypothetical protein
MTFDSATGSGNNEHTENKMDADRQQRLEALPGWSWDPLTDQWESGFSRLSDFSQREGHCRVPTAYKTEDGYRLGYWVNQQRTIRDKIDPERRRRLDAPGFDWDPRANERRPAAE